MIGLILSTRRINNAARHYFTDDYFSFYTTQARKNKVDLCIYSIDHINVHNKTVDGFVYDYRTNVLMPKNVPIPRLNLYRLNASLKKKAAIQKVRQLSEEDGIIFFNACTKRERSKYHDYLFLNSFKEIRPCLPETASLSWNSLLGMLKRYETVFVKPKFGGKGNHIYIIRRKSNHYTIDYFYRQTKDSRIVHDKELKTFYSETFSRPSRYIVQQGIPLKTYQGRKFDIRVSPQKNKMERWQITGMFARVAKEGWDVTNLDKGGKAKYTLKRLLSMKTKKEIHRLSLLIAQALEQRFPYMIDMGLDFAVDQDEKIWLLEANFRPFRKQVKVKRNRIPFEYVCAVYRRLKE
ncbi:hypothetical protein J2S00_001711 [Caldalkalibacillus uzonensis]|uniref:YheC/YheD family protein n=1 Tax=Caldalkalibacillus uzonensis TaxID=353224 RepID=A0ABU0CTU0_9BACI|nr:YheC/YheD family protein [Caldalkalibacillus uzonensis]MDQ0338925.1 hypothetical protein [Caldalkalibacillus uzonensis]